MAAASPYLMKHAGQVPMEKILYAAVFLPVLIWIHFGLRRLVNLGMSRLWFLALFAPFLNLWVGYRCFVCPPGYAYHKKLDGPGVVLAILYGLGVAALARFLMATFASSPTA